MFSYLEARFQLWSPAFVGFIVFIVVEFSGNRFVERFGHYMVFIVVNSRLFHVLETVQRAIESSLGYFNSKSVDEVRVEFRGITYPDPVTDDMRSWKRNKYAQILTKIVSWVSIFSWDCICPDLSWVTLLERNTYSCAGSPRDRFMGGTLPSSCK